MLLRINVDAPADKITEFGAGAKLYWARDNTSAAGAFTDASGNVALVATQTQYEIIDATGAVGHFYRTRIGNTGGTSFDTWSDVFQAGAPTAYATIDALRELLNLPDNSRDNYLSDLLRQVTERINKTLHFDFFRHPAVTGTEIRTYDGHGRTWLHVTQGVVSLTLVRSAVDTGQTYSSMAATDWRLRQPVMGVGPYLSVQLTSVGNYPYFYRGFDTIELTGVFGYTAIPDDIVAATLEWAAAKYRAGPGGGRPLSATGEEIGGEGGGEDRFLGGMPYDVFKTVEEYRKLHQGALVA